MAQHDAFIRPVHNIDLHAPGALDALFAFHRSIFGGWQMSSDSGGGDGGAGGGGQGSGEAGGSGGSGGSGDSGGSGSGDGDTGFPPNTPLEQMTAPQREAYWKHQARKHEDRVKGLDNLTPDQLKELREKAKKHDELEHELKSDKDKAVDEAKSSTRAEADSEYRPKLVKAEFKAAAAGRITAEQLTTLLEPLDLSKFLTTSGDVDTDKVAKYVDGIAPAKGTQSSGPLLTRHVGSGSGTGSGGGNRPGSVAQVMEERRAARAEKQKTA